MTKAELVAHIKSDIVQKGGAHVPMSIVQVALSSNPRAFTALNTVLEDFANAHGWHFQHEALPSPLAIFYPVERAGKLSEMEER
jgi:hypothetical protein